MSSENNNNNNTASDSNQMQGLQQNPAVKVEETKPEKSVKKRKKKLEIACVYCRRSHMICDESRPCQRCIKRGIGHLCYDEPSNPRQRKKAAALRKTQSEGPPFTSTTPATVPIAGTSSTQSPLPLPPLQASSSDMRPTPNAVAVSPQQQQQQQQQVQAQQNQQVQPQQQQQQYNNLQPKIMKNSVLSQTMPYNQQPFFYSEHAGSEFSSLNDFLSMIDDPELVNGALNDDTNGLLNFGSSNNNNNGFSLSGGNSTTNLNAVLAFSPNSSLFPNTFPTEQGQQNEQQLQQQQQQQQQQQPQQQQSQQQQQQSQLQNQQQQALTQPQPQQNQTQVQTQEQTEAPVVKTEPQQQQQQQQGHPVISDSARDKFFLTAADPTTEISPEERLKQVIKAKLEAGLLQPYNYAKGYARLQRYMDNYMNVSSRQRILKPLSIFRPAFRAIARTLKDVDLVLVEESFERMLLDYDRVFTSMAIPACLWRRTGEIYRGNKSKSCVDKL
ncbi:putative transcriptional regulatory protein, putative (Zinc cluster transcription factor, putative) [Candida maltosa Xu316]|uniref:Putative transcriptional regulatory protein, putative (Zinc cluster transcription factor, putative) n=1 Tax=Candida maltosa (strain Xu316) TaxID=1245528 RepID=M3HM78_CANMX|nr:putative transcriptional regulatory protein, putative (Zinc cluster transcription factor, putative) [Candida maltosa Xu316]